VFRFLAFLTYWFADAAELPRLEGRAQATNFQCYF
jgi:hypothetical protein